MFDITKVRSNFPFLSATPTPIYLDNASTTQKPQVVLDAMTEFYAFHNGNVGRGNHRYTRESTERYEEARQKVARFINAKSTNEIVFTSNATDSMNLIVNGWASNQLKKGDVILLTHGEHHSNYLPWLQVACKTGAVIKYISLKTDGTIDINSLINLLTHHQVKIVALAHVSNVFGTVNPIRKVSELTKQHHPDAIMIVDAAQSVGHIPINLDQLKCDFLVFSAHKMYGPMGLGVLYGQAQLLEAMTPLGWGGGMISDIDEEESITLRRVPARFEPGTPNVAGAVGLSAAIDFIQSLRIDRILAHEQELTAYLLQSLENAGIEGLKTYGPTLIKDEKQPHRLGIVSFTIEGIAAEDLGNYLDDDNIMIRSGHHCTIPLHRTVLKAVSTTRVSLGVYNTRNEVDQLMSSLRNAVTMLRG